MADDDNPIKKDVTIGDCRLILGDCLKVMPLLGAVDHVISDPPYEAIMQDAKNALQGRLRRDGGPEIRSLGFQSIDDIRADVVSHVSRLCNGWLIAFCTIEGTAHWADAINPSPLKYKRPCIWVKPDCTPQLNGQGPAIGGECFVTAWCGAGRSAWNAGGKRGVYTHNVNPPDRHGTHPTEKPWRLFAEIIRDFTNAGDSILDPFMGSGTTGVACVKLGRKFTGVELDEDYFEIACERISKAYEQPDMFVKGPESKPVQNTMDL